uniref:Uncharacterized protein n=1 Tax=Anguilla anguilla TaxID=7936 RepID=A0A0E9UJD4_ANGAN
MPGVPSLLSYFAFWEISIL